MKVAVSYLKSNFSFDKTLEKIEEAQADFIHVDVMDGLFVNNKTYLDKEMLNLLKKSKVKKDVHLMTLHIENYIDVFAKIEPEFITFSYEATSNPEEIIAYLKEKKIKVGMAINPLTNIEEITSLLPKLDLVLLMGVVPGYGGQKFILGTIDKFNQLKKIRAKENYKFLISVDGGINAETIKLFDDNLDIAVAGTYICTYKDFKERIESLKQVNG